MKQVVETYLYGGRYLPIVLVGSGSFSWVSKALDQKMNRTVAIKVAFNAEGMSYEERVSMFKAEAETGANLFHPNIVRILDFTYMNEHMDKPSLAEPIIVMDYVAGTKLWNFSQKNELSIPRIVDICIQVTKALEYTHNLEVPVIHRDIREDNLMINKVGHVFLIDWGVSRRKKPVMTTTSAKGTFGFMSPEVMDVEIKGVSQEIDGRADLFSLGVLLYKLITRDLPFKNYKNPGLLRKEIKEQCFEKPSVINSLCPVSLENIVLRLLKENREERIENATKLLEELNEIVKEVGPASIHDCESIVPDILLSKESVDQPVEESDEQTTHVSGAPQAIRNRIDTKFLKIAGGIVLSVFVLVMFKFFIKPETKQIAEARPQMPTEIVQPVKKVNSTVPTPEEIEKMLNKPKRNPTASFRSVNGPAVQTLGNSLVVYSKDNPDQKGFAMVKNYGVVVGTNFDAVITHQIETSNINSPVKAILTKDILVKQKVIFPKNSKVLGSAFGDQNERIQIHFDRIILPDEREIEFDGSALDVTEALGIKGKMDREKTKRMNSSGGRVLGAAATGLIDGMTGTGIAGQAANNAGKEAVDLTQGDVDARNQAATVVRLEGQTNLKIRVNRTF